MKINERIQQRRKELNMTLEQVANIVGVNRSTIYKYETGNTEKMPTSVLIPLSKALRCSPTYLLGIEDEISYQSDYLNIPLYNELCCGNGGFVEDNIIEYIPVPSNTLPLNAEYFCQKAIGDSMKDAGIYDGDLLIFLKTPYIENNDIGCFCIGENMATCKKYKYSNGIVTLLPMNSNYDPIIIDVTNENFRCLGRLKYSIRKY